MNRHAKAHAQLRRGQLNSQAPQLGQHTLASEIRRLHKLSALVACLQHAVNYNVSEDLRVDVSDALAALLLLIDHEIDSLDQLSTLEVSP